MPEGFGCWWSGAAGYGDYEISISTAWSAWLSASGLTINAPARIDSQGRGGQTSLFHAATQFHDWGLAMTRLLLDHGADVMAQATVQGRFDHPDDWFTGTAIDYAAHFPADMRSSGEAVRGLLQARRHGGRVA